MLRMRAPPSALVDWSGKAMPQYRPDGAGRHAAPCAHEKAARRRLPAHAGARVRAQPGSHHLGDRLADIVDVLAVERSHAHATGVGAVHAELGAQAHHLVLGQARVAEHADLLRDEGHVLLHAGSLEAIHQLLAHGLDAHAHLAQLLLPQCTQFGVAQHGGHHRAAMRGRVGVVGADHDLQLAQHAGGFFLVGAQHGQAAHALAVQAEALGEGGGNEEAQAGSHELLDHRAVFLDAVAEALVGHVEEGRQALGLDHRHHLVPLLGRDVVAGRVVAAGVQHDDGAGRGGLEAGQHAVEVHAALGRVVVGVAIDHEAGIGEQRAVVLPARIGDQHLGIGADLLEEIGADLQAAGTADGLHGGHTARGDGLAARPEHQRLDGIVIGDDAVDGQVAACRRLVHHGFFSGLDALQQGQLAVVVEIHAHPQVDLVGVGVSSVLLVQTQDRVARCHFDGGEERHGVSLGYRRRMSERETGPVVLCQVAPILRAPP